MNIFLDMGPDTFIYPYNFIYYMKKEVVSYFFGFIAFVLYFLLMSFEDKTGFPDIIIFDYLFNLAAAISVFFLFSVVLFALKKRFTRKEITDICLSFLAIYLLRVVVSYFADFSFVLGTMQNVSFLQALAGFFSILISSFVFISSILLISSHFFNFFQNAFGIKEKVEISLILETKIVLSLLLSLVIFFFLSFFVLTYFGVLVFLLVFVFPMFIIVFFIETPKGVRLDRKEHPKVFKIVDDSASALDLLAPSEILLVPNTTVTLCGLFRKRLILGISFLRTLSKKEFSSIITQEYSHYFGYDNFIGSFFFYLNSSFSIVIKNLNASKRSQPHLFLFYYASLFYNYLFKIISAPYFAASEYKADFISSQVCGSNNVSNAILNYETYLKHFDKYAYNNIVDYAKQDKVFSNIYSNNVWFFKYFKRYKEDILQKRFFIGFRPKISTRLLMISEFPAVFVKKKVSAQSLFKNFEKLEKEMTSIITGIVFYQLGIIDEKGDKVNKKE